MNYLLFLLDWRIAVALLVEHVLFWILGIAALVAVWLLCCRPATGARPWSGQGPKP